MSSTLSDRRVGGYQLGALAGRGPASAVYEAVDLRSGATVALKLFRHEPDGGASQQRRVLRESRRAEALGHPNIVPLLSAAEFQGQLYTVTRFVRGGDVRRLIGDEGRISVSRAIFVVQQAAHALDTAHAQRVIHGNVAASNVVVERRSGHVYLRDFGHHAAGDVRSDLHGLGRVVYEVLTGRPPPVAVEDLAELAADGDLARLEDVLQHALADDPQEQYASGGELVHDVRAALRRRTRPLLRPPPEPAPVAGPEAAPAGAQDLVRPTLQRPPPATESEAVARTPRPGWTRGLLHGVPLVLVTAGAAISAYVVERTLSGHAPAVAGARPAAAGGQGVSGTRAHGADAALLVGLHDAAIRRTCRPLQAPGRVAALACSALAPGGALIELHVSRFGSLSATTRAFRAQALPAVRAAGGRVGAAPGASAGLCDPSSWLGSGAWRGAGRRGGLVACFVVSPSAQGCAGVPAPRCAVLYWTSARDHLAVRASTAEDASARLFAWWRSHRDRFGSLNS